MLRRIRTWQVMLLTAAGLLMAASFAAPQQEPPKAAPGWKDASTRGVNVYRLDFVVRELEDGKQLNSRSYSLSAKSDDWGGLRVGSRVPVGPTQGYKELTYEPVGINIDCQPHERDEGGGVLLDFKFESTSLAVSKEPQGASEPVPPIFRQVRFSGNSLVALGKPTVISKLDDVTSNRHYEVEVTATKVK